MDGELVMWDGYAPRPPMPPNKWLLNQFKMAKKQGPKSKEDRIITYAIGVGYVLLLSIIAHLLVKLADASYRFAKLTDEDDNNASEFGFEQNQQNSSSNRRSTKQASHNLWAEENKGAP
jgi:uncharacterized BrkB/YihY/UPF0761 family membrane protein